MISTTDPAVASATPAPSQTAWPLWRRLLFRFTFIYVALYLSPAQWGGNVPLAGFVAEYYTTAESWLVTWANRYLFHIKDELVPLNGSGDTSYGFAQLCLFALLALVGTVVWSLLDWRRRQYNRLSYWFLVGLRYYVAMVALLYGSIKVFGLQMIFPSLSQLATPLGDLLPMRFSWLFIGYSAPYQFFSGLMETVAGVLLLWRRTATLGAMTATGVFLNVMVLNLCYDIPVKLFSTHLFAFSLLLLLGDAPRLLNFFVFNRPAPPSVWLRFNSRRARIGRLVLKGAFIILFGVMPFYQTYWMFNQASSPSTKPKLKAGFYDVTEFQSRATLPDSLRWQNVVIEPDGQSGSIQASDTLFRQRYGRSYFNYALDSLQRELSIYRANGDSLALLTLSVSHPDTNRLLLRGRFHGDSLTVALRRTNRRFPLADRQFHWLSEANR